MANDAGDIHKLADLIPDEAIRQRFVHHAQKLGLDIEAFLVLILDTHEQRNAPAQNNPGDHQGVP